MVLATQHTNIFRTAVLSVVFLCACRPTASGLGQQDYAKRFGGRKHFQQFVARGWESPFGLDYVFVHSAAARNRELVNKICENIPIRWVNFARLEWGKVERHAPRNGKHEYDWSDMDQAVRAWQSNGVHVMVSARFFSPWATAPRPDRNFVYLKGPAKWFARKGADYLPKPERWSDFHDYVRSLVERYDGDGRNDMPGLLFPILHYQVGNEYYNELFWAGSADEYGELLRAFAKSARAACPKVKIILSGIGLKEIYGFYDATPGARTSAYVRSQLAKVPPEMRPFIERSFQFSKTSVGMCDAYDILDARWPDYGIVTASKMLLQQANCRHKEVWSAEIYCGFPLMEHLVLPNWTLHAWPTPTRSKEYLGILRNPRHPRFKAINAWYRGLQAAQVVKICMVALHAGSRKLMMGWAVDMQNPLAMSTLSHHGLYSATFKRLWPAGYTYGLLIRKLEGLEQVRRLHTPPDTYVYDCQLPGKRHLFVAFYDDHIAQNHDQPTGTTKAAIPIVARRVRITHIITRIGQTEPESRVVDVDRNSLRISLTEYPVIIEVVAHH